MKTYFALLFVAVNLMAVFACTIEEELAMLQAMKQMKECKKCALRTSLKPLKDCKAIIPPLELPKLKWGKFGKYGKGCHWNQELPPYSPLIFLLPSAVPPQQLQGLRLQPATLTAESVGPKCPIAAAPPPPVFLTPSAPPAPAAPQTFFAPPPPAYTAPNYAVPQDPIPPVYRQVITQAPVPPPQTLAPAPPAPPTCAAPQQQLFYMPQAHATCPKRSPLLFLSNKGYGYA